MSWREYCPKECEKDFVYLQRKKDELEELRAAGFEATLSLGYHDTLPWMHENYCDTYYVDQFGERYIGDTFAGEIPIDNGDATLIFNGEMCELVASCAKDILAEFGTNLYAARLSGGYWGQLTYPTSSFRVWSNLYWAYDRNAQINADEAGVAGWKPGDPSSKGEAGRYLEWYLDSLIEYQNWQIETLRESYAGRFIVLYPSWSVPPEQAGEVVATDLDRSTAAERYSEAWTLPDISELQKTRTLWRR